MVIQWRRGEDLQSRHVTKACRRDLQDSKEENESEESKSEKHGMGVRAKETRKIWQIGSRKKRFKTREVEMNM